MAWNHLVELGSQGGLSWPSISSVEEEGRSATVQRIRPPRTVGPPTQYWIAHTCARNHHPQVKRLFSQHKLSIYKDNPWSRISLKNKLPYSPSKHSPPPTKKRKSTTLPYFSLSKIQISRSLNPRTSTLPAPFLLHSSFPPPSP